MMREKVWVKLCLKSMGDNFVKSMGDNFVKSMGEKRWVKKYGWKLCGKTL